MSESFRILIVDDEPNNRELLRAMLEDGPYEIDEAADGQEALELLNLATYHLVVTDLRMPGMTGLELLEQAKVLHPRLPIVVVTAHASVETTIDALRLGATNFLKKPFSRDEICTVAMKSLKPWHINAGKRSIIPTMRKTISLDLRSTADVIDPVFYHVLDDAASLGFPEDCLQMHVYLALNEALANAMDHGHAGDPEKIIHFEATLTADTIELQVTDQGEGFDPDLLPDPTSPENLMNTRGRGVFLMRCYMDSVRYLDGGRTVHLVKHRPQSDDEKPSPPE